jgi:hypothetical protein
MDNLDSYLCAKIVHDALSLVNVILMSLYRGLLKKSAMKRFPIRCELKNLFTCLHQTDQQEKAQTKRKKEQTKTHLECQSASALC